MQPDKCHEKEAYAPAEYNGRHFTEGMQYIFNIFRMLNMGDF